MNERAGQLAYELYCEALSHAAVGDRYQVPRPPAWPFLSQPERAAWCAVGAEIPVRRLAERSASDDGECAADASDRLRTGPGAVA